MPPAGPLLLPADWQPLGQCRPPSSELVVYRVAWADWLPRPADWLAWVPAAEQARAARYAQPADQARFLVARAALRGLLGQHLDLPPAAVPLALTAFGKPHLPVPRGLHFNLSHSGAWVVLVLAPCEVGIDAEEVRPDFTYDDVARSQFGPGGQRHLQQSADPRGTFYYLWTRREALAKATGHGLGEAPAADEATRPGWQLRSFEVAAGYPAALAYPAAWQPAPRFITLPPGPLK